MVDIYQRQRNSYEYLRQLLVGANEKDIELDRVVFETSMKFAVPEKSVKKCIAKLLNFSFTHLTILEGIITIRVTK